MTEIRPTAQESIGLSLEQKVCSFWAKVDRSAGPTGCWIWKGAVTSKHGYGCFQTGGRVLGAHKVAWLLTNGDARGLCILHHCDNRVCVNPAHLYLGTKIDNARDKLVRGRDTVCRLTPDQVREIRALFPVWKNGMGKELARKYDVSNTVISDIKLGRTYAHVK